jgi:hypothetical protein
MAGYFGRYCDWPWTQEHMRRTLLSLGLALYLIGVSLVLGNVVMSYHGQSASYNFGDPTRFQFFLVPFWQLGLAIAVIGALCLLLYRRIVG